MRANAAGTPVIAVDRELPGRVNVMFDYREVLEEHGIAYDDRRVYYGQFWEKPTHQEMERMLQEWEELPEAIVCANDAMAIAVNDFLKKKGYRVPDELMYRNKQQHKNRRRD